MAARRLFFTVYGLSGCAALTYEVVWTRLLALQMGHTVAAVSTVLAAFMGGMALGAYAAGRFAARRSPNDALRAYGWLELVVAVSALALPFVLAAFRPLLVVAYADGDGGRTFALVRVILSLVTLGVPCAAMGATFPVASRWIVQRIDRTAAAAGGLYAANTVGAAAGAAIAAFVLIPAVGLRATTWIAVLMNLAAAAVSFAIAAQEQRVVASAPARVVNHRQGKKTRKVRSEERARAEPAATTGSGRPLIAALALAVTGLVALVNEVAWTRVIALVIGPTTYAFGAMLTVFITGLAIGSAIAARVADRLRQPVAALALVMIAVGASAAAAMPRVARLPVQIAEAVSASDAEFGAIVRSSALMTASLLLPLTIALGAAFPIALKVAARERDSVARDVASVYAANTMGAITGSLCGGFVLVPLLGLHGTIVTASLVAIAGAVVLLAWIRPRAVLLAPAVAAAIVAAAWVWTSTAWDVDLLSSGAYKYAPYIEEPDFESALKAGTLLYYKDGATATVSVRRVAGTTGLAIDGKVDASNAGDMLTQKLLGHLPLLLHSRPQRVAIIGLGSGVTLGAALRHPIERADVLEISPEVVAASRFFQAENHGALADPRTRLIVGDGRSHLLLGTRTYDVIVSEPSNPWMAGIASLFTREFFEAARRALAPDGMLCQWAHTYDISDEDLRSIVATFASVFPDGTMWLIGSGDLLLVGSPAPMLPRLETLRASFARAGVAADLAEVSVRDAASIYSLYAGGPSELQAYSRGAALQTDDRTALEFSAPRSIFGRSRQDNVATIGRLLAEENRPPVVRDALTRATAVDWRNRGQMLLQAEAYRRAYDGFARAVALDPSDESAIDGLTRAAGGASIGVAALRVLSAIAAEQPENVPIHIALSRLLGARGDVEGAIEAVRPLIVSKPGDPRPAEQAASVLADAGDTARLEPLVALLREKWPTRPAVTYYAASLAFLTGNTAAALELADRGVQDHGAEARLHTLRGAALAGLGRRDEARAAFENARARDPRDSSAYVNLGLLDLETGRPEDAANEFAEALILEPTSTRAREGLADALGRLGHTDRAERVRLATGRQISRRGKFSRQPSRASNFLVSQIQRSPRS